MKLIKLNIGGISYSETQTGAYALVLSEVDGDRKLPIIIGGFEAQSIAIALDRGVRPVRPLTHDLFKKFAECFKIVVKQVVIHKLVDGIFYANMICERNEIEEVIDSRTSDAIAMAVRFNVPIYTHDSILKEAGFTTGISSEKYKKPLEGDWTQNFETSQNRGGGSGDLDIKKISTPKLKTLLNNLVSEENYEYAIKVRNELSRREAQG